MTVKELIKELEQWPSYLEVYTEGCDCVGTTGNVVRADEYGYKNAIIIERKKEEEF